MTQDYPTEEQLQKIKTWDAMDFPGLMEYIRGLWAFDAHGFNYDPTSGIYHLSTVGWSGNEEIIAALKSNHIVWIFYWESSRRGGHYTFSMRMLGSPSGGGEAVGG